MSFTHCCEHIISVLQNSLVKKYMNVLVAYINFPQSTGHVSKIWIYIHSLKKNGNEFLPVEMLSLILRWRSVGLRRRMTSNIRRNLTADCQRIFFSCFCKYLRDCELSLINRTHFYQSLLSLRSFFNFGTSSDVCQEGVDSQLRFTP